MVTKKSSKKKVSKKRLLKKKADTDDPPIIVGGGGSEIIKIRSDLAVSLMQPTGNYNRFRVAGVNIRRVVVNGHSDPVNPSSHTVVFEE